MDQGNHRIYFYHNQIEIYVPTTYTGILFDVSCSMRESLRDGINVQRGQWFTSIVTVIDDIIKHDLSEENRLFAIGFGSKQKQNVFDTLKSLEQFSDQRPAQFDTIEEVFRILERHGAKNIRKWADKNVISLEIKECKALIILKNLKKDTSFTRWFVNECLPSVCRDWSDNRLLGGFQAVFSSAVTTFKKASPEDIRNIIEKAMKPDRMSVLEGVSSSSLYSTKHASDIIHSCVDVTKMTAEKAREYFMLLEPYIYGDAPLYSALKESTELYPILMRNDDQDAHRRLLFVLTDGKHTDNGDIYKIKERFDQKGVKVVGCYISHLNNVEPKQLYSTYLPNWDAGAKLLFDLSSQIPTAIVTRAIFVKHGWEIDVKSNTTRLFMHVNHPEHIQSACELVRNAVCYQDALSDILVSISLDLYINQKNAGVRAHDQGLEETCYAHAAATVVHLAMCRILGRDGGYPKFEQLRDDMISRHGRHGADTLMVLQEVCRQYRLRCRKVNSEGAMEAVAKKRPVIARFWLTSEEWNTFREFYRNNRKSTLRKSDLDIALRSSCSVTSGHAVVLTSYNSKCLCLMNSWGDQWANNGFFKVKNAEVLGLEFIDVYWTKDDLSVKEKNYYRLHGSEVAARLIRTLKALQVGTFTCPHCKETANVNEFFGTLLNVFCSRCNRSFSSYNGQGNLLALNMYLTSLCM